MPTIRLGCAIRVAAAIACSLAGCLQGEEFSWALKDPMLDHQEGTSTQKAYAELHLKAPAKPIVVAVIDSGVDISHPDLKDVIWINDKPGTDPAQDGFVNDLHGWNFIGSKDGRELTSSRMEITREVARLRHLQQGPPAQTLPDAELRRLTELTRMYEGERDAHMQGLSRQVIIAGVLDELVKNLQQQGLTDTSASGIGAFAAKNPSALLMKSLFRQIDPQGISAQSMQQTLASSLADFDAQYGLDFDESTIIGDDPAKLDERGYGNSQVSVIQTAFHGTLVAGVIGATKDVKLGVMGQCAWARIMVIRAVPNGDERDKDVANAVRYAVDHGAQIINMSFGKTISPNKAYVDAAFRYAAEKNVLVVHASGNSGMDTDRTPFYPNPRPQAEGKGVAEAPFPNWIEVGASSNELGEHLAAPFSNYGATTVDVFAPGTQIVSTAVGGGKQAADGTSLASPEVAGVAALVLSQHPELTAVQLRKALLDHVRRYPGLMVDKPGTENEKVAFSSLSRSGGIIDAYATLRALDPLAAQHDALPPTPAVVPTPAAPIPARTP